MLANWQLAEQLKPTIPVWLRLTFSHGAIKDVDLSAILNGGGVFTRIRENRNLFKQVRIKPNSRTIEWPGGIDLDPDVLYGSHEPASGKHLTRRTVREPAHA
jgi:hypothetical protein